MQSGLLLLFEEIKSSKMDYLSAIKNNAVIKRNDCEKIAVSIVIQNNPYETTLYLYQIFID